MKAIYRVQPHCPMCKTPLLAPEPATYIGVEEVSVKCRGLRYRDTEDMIGIACGWEGMAAFFMEDRPGETVLTMDQAVAFFRRYSAEAATMTDEEILGRLRAVDAEQRQKTAAYFALKGGS